MQNPFTITELNLPWDRADNGVMVYRKRFFVERVEQGIRVSIIRDYGNYDSYDEALKRKSQLDKGE